MVRMHLHIIGGPFVPHNLIWTQGSPLSLLKFQMDRRLNILMASGCKKGTQIYFPFYQKSWQTNHFQVPQQVSYEYRGLFTGHFAYLSETSSFGFPSKGALPQGPFMESLAERCPTTRALPHSSIKIPGIRAPSTYQVPLEWKGAPMERDARFRRTS